MEDARCSRVSREQSVLGNLEDLEGENPNLQQVQAIKMIAVVFSCNHILPYPTTLSSGVVKDTLTPSLKFQNPIIHQ